QVSATPSAMTEGYAAARDGFYAITGVLLPELEEVEMLPSSDIRENQHTVACFDIPGDAITLEAIKDALIEQLGVPEDEDATGARWSIVVNAEEGYYAGWLDAMLDVEADPSAIYVNYSGGPVSASYVRAQSMFAGATGVVLPLLAGFNVSVGMGGNSFMFDVYDAYDGDPCTVWDFENSFEPAFDLLGWEKGEPDVREYEDNFLTLTYTNPEGGVIQLMYDGFNNSIYINSMYVDPSFDPYGDVQVHFAEEFGILLPDWDGVKVTDMSISPDGKEITFGFGFDALSYEDYLELEASFESDLGECDEGYPQGDEEGRDAHWQVIDVGVWISITWTPAGLDYNDDPCPAGIDINVSPLAE
ncbi:MAG: hypothetical protein J5755_02880, partial [Clostridia bacterium]|nr:hypothetical protein [Clostridia bacterium]